MTDQEKKRIEDYINTYRSYPDEYKGIRDIKVLRTMDGRYRYDSKRRMITRAEGRINQDGNFEIVNVYRFSMDDPENKIAVGFTDWTQVINRYNDLMIELGYPGNTIGTEFSDGTDQWTLRDMVAEVDYIKNTFYERGHINNKMRTEDPKQWLRYADRLRYFVRKYREKIDGIAAYKKHNSEYDN